MTAAASHMQPEFLRVLGTARETADTLTFELDTRDRGGFRFLPGQFNMLYAFGTGESAISISGDAEQPDRLVHTIRTVGSVTRLLTQVKKGDVVGVRGPFGQGFPIAESRDKHLVVVAGGIGLAPLRPVVLHAIRHLRDFASVSLVYGARTPRDLLYSRELQRWASGSGLRVEVTVDRSDASWDGHTGVVTKLLAPVVRFPESTAAMICGPEVMMRFAARELMQLGVGAAQITISTERNMRCGVGLCGHCQLGPFLLCRDGPAIGYDRIGHLLTIREL